MFAKLIIGLLLCCPLQMLCSADLRLFREEKDSKEISRGFQRNFLTSLFLKAEKPLMMLDRILDLISYLSKTEGYWEGCKFPRNIPIPLFSKVLLQNLFCFFSSKIFLLKLY